MIHDPDPMPAPATVPDDVARPEQPPMDDDAAGIEEEDEAAKLGDFA